ncbi:hypothetical protein EJ110_NYTH55653 [Nymphaea thermarum]|nr:hypothetical protein EJ110_NYTH55653 [Nymphaea thermarum]
MDVNIFNYKNLVKHIPNLSTLHHYLEVLQTSTKLHGDLYRGVLSSSTMKNTMDFRIARLFRKWGHVKVRHISIAMAALAFLYRGLTKFSIGDADSIEGCVFTLQAWFYKHVGPQSCNFQNTDGQLSSMEHYRRKMEEVDDSTIIWDFFDREVIKSRYTYNPVRGSLLLGPFFIVEYHSERCLRQLSLRQRKAYPIESEGAIVECELDTEEWTGIYTYAQQRWESFAHLYLVLGLGMGPEYVKWFIQNVETAPTITTLCYLKQRPGEKVRDFIQRWRSSCNKMRDLISQSHALGLIVNNLTQPLRSLISNAPIKSFIDLTERAECIEAGIENGAFDAVIPVKVRKDTKKNSRSQNASANIEANAAIFKKEKLEYPKNKGVMDRASGSSSGTKNKHPGWGYDRKFTPLQ